MIQSRRRHNSKDRNDLEVVQTMTLRNPALHQAPLGYAKDGPFTWVAERRVPREPPNPTRLAMAKWMIENGSDVHQGGDAPLMRAALDHGRISMMELLVAYGADVAERSREDKDGQRSFHRLIGRSEAGFYA